jgi:hypothetical protein
MKATSLPLVVLVADKNMEATVRGLLERHEILGIRPLRADVFVHPYRDPGVLNDAHNFLRPLHKQYERALVLFDHEGCGRETQTPSQLQAGVRQRLESSGWSGRCEVILLVPELEVWVWSDSPYVPQALGLGSEELAQVLNQYGKTATGKPERPKEAMETALRRSRIPRSSALYSELARNVNLQRCADPAFQQLRDTLRQWFGKGKSGGSE